MEYYERIYLKSVDSTSTYAKQVAQNKLSYNYLIISDKQTSGYGKLKKEWVSFGKNLYMSILLINTNYDKAEQLCFVAGIGIYNAISKLGAKNIKLKWPNDIMINDAKLGGILIEKYNNNTIIGIGINMESSPKLDYPTTSLNQEEIFIDRGELIKLILRYFSQYKIRWEMEGFDFVHKLLTKCSYKIGEVITIKHHNNEIVGKFDSINQDGSILLISSNNKKHEINIGDVLI